jgi:hypothetical protein
MLFAGGTLNRSLLGAPPTDDAAGGAARRPDAPA